MVSMVTDHRVPKKYVGRLVLRSMMTSKRRWQDLSGKFSAADKVYLEGPHIFKRKDWYYLFAADTGTGELHGQSILRSKNVWGSYEWYEGNSILTAREHPDFLLQNLDTAILLRHKTVSGMQFICVVVHLRIEIQWMHRALQGQDVTHQEEKRVYRK